MFISKNNIIKLPLLLTKLFTVFTVTYRLSDLRIWGLLEVFKGTTFNYYKHRIRIAHNIHIRRIVEAACILQLIIWLIRIEYIVPDVNNKLNKVNAWSKKLEDTCP